MLFGEFIRKKRLELDLEAKEVGIILGLSPQYMSDLEKGRRQPPSEDILKKLIKVLRLSKDEIYLMYDLAGKGRDVVSYDISRYVLSKESARIALRTANEKKLGNDFWEKVNKLAKEEGER